MDANLPYTHLRDMIFMHPTIYEALNESFNIKKEAAFFAASVLQALFFSCYAVIIPTGQWSDPMTSV